MRSGTVQSGQAELAFDRSGSGSSMLLVHSGIAARGMWDGTFERLASRHDVVRVDLRGYGDTALPDEPFSMADDLLRVIDALGLAPATLVGASMGGRAVIDAALLAPEKIAGLVLVGAAASGLPITDPELDAIDRQISAAVERQDFDEAARLDVSAWIVGVGRDRSDLADGVEKRAMALARATYPVAEHPEEFEHEPNAAARLGEIRVPTLVVIGGYDRPHAQQVATTLFDRIEGARHVLMEGVAHLPSLEAPDALADIVLQFAEEYS